MAIMRALPIFPVCFALALFTAFAIGGCAQNHPSIETTPLCIQVPPTLSTNEKKIGADIAAKLEQLKVDGSLKANYERAARSEWGKLSDANAELFIFLQAIDCYLQRPTPISQEMARELMNIVRARWGASQNIAGTTPNLSRLEKSKLSETIAGQESLKLYRKFGLE